MKRLLVILLLLSQLLVAAEERSPDAKRRNWRVGIISGLNFAFAEAEPETPGSAREGLVTGVVAEKRIKRNIFFQPEFRFIQQGVDSTLRIVGIQRTGTIKLDSLQFPLLFKFDFWRKRKNGFFALVGPTFSFLLKREMKLPLLKLSLNNRFRSFDVGVLLGLGYEAWLAGNTWLFFGLRYTHGISDLDREDSFRSRNAELGLGIMTRL